MFPLEVSNFRDLFSFDSILTFSLFSVAITVLLFLSSLKFLLAFQQGGYHGKRYFKWLSNPKTLYLSRLMLLSLLGFLFFCVLSMCFSSVLSKTISSYIGFISFFLFSALYVNTESAVNAKVPLKKTKRLIRLLITYFIILLIISFSFIVLLNYLAFLINDEVVAILRYSLICVLPILTPYFLMIAYLINEPMEEFINYHYLKIAKDKLKRFNVIKIGITGSFGKTSVKEILKTILSQKYRVLATPESYNTPLGIALTVKKLDTTHDIFIAEMGARQKGDIKKLTDLVKPKYGILTGINTQHLEYFKTIENTKSTKYELFEGLPKDGVGFFATETIDAKELFDKFDKEKYAVSIEDEGGFVKVSNVKTSSYGTEFVLNINGEKPVKCSTVLLGTHSIKNIILASAVAYKIGLTPSEIASGINRITSIGHRLELVPNNKGVVIIDDSYNSNPDGIVAAMEVLNMFNGRKIVVTPGMVELGKMENVYNLQFGKMLAKNADIVIIVGSHNAEMIINGLLEENFNKENIIFVKNLKRGNDELNKILKEGDVVLFENDLPDNYS